MPRGFDSVAVLKMDLDARYPFLPDGFAGKRYRSECICQISELVTPECAGGLCVMKLRYSFLNSKSGGSQHIRKLIIVWILSRNTLQMHPIQVLNTENVV